MDYKRTTQSAGALGSRPAPAAPEPVKPDWNVRTDDFGQLDARGYLSVNPRFKLNPNRLPDENYWRQRVPARERA